MRRPAWLAMLGVCAALLTFSMVAPPAASDSSSQTGRGGTLRVDLDSDFDSIDPALAYSAPSWQLQYQTSCKLVNYPDTEGKAGVNLVPEVAQGPPKVTRKGRTYTFTIRPGFRFSNGQAVTAANFGHAIKRALSPRMQSPARSFTGEISGVTAKGQTLNIRLKKPAPDFLQRMSMPFFSAVPTSTPIRRGGVGADLATCGPYHVRSWIKGKTATLVRNPHYGGRRPANPDQIVFNLNVAPSAQAGRCESGVSDVCTALGAADYQRISDRFGVNRDQFFAKPTWGVGGLVLNTRRPLFRANAPLRRAVNYAIDRPQLVRQHGALGGSRTDQMLRSDFPGGRNANIYPLDGPNLGRARALAKGHTRGGRAVFYTPTQAPGPAIAQVVQFNLRQIGIDVEIKRFDRTVLDRRTSTRGEPFDIALDQWTADYPDPYNFINVLLDGRRIQATNNTNESYFNDARYNQRMDRTSRLIGARRYAAFGSIEIDVTRRFAPWATYINSNARTFVSSRVTDFVYQPIYGPAYGAMSINVPAPTCGQPLTATLTVFVGQPHLQVFGDCAALMSSGLAQVEMTAPPGKTIVAFAPRSGSVCTGSGSARTCSVLPDGRFCTILDFSPDAAANDQVKIRLLKADGTPLEDKTVSAGAEQPNCSRAP